MDLPSVTEVLAPWSRFDRVPAAILESAAARGTAVHAACATIARGGVPVVAPEIQGYVDSYYLVFEQVQEVLLVEEELIDTLTGYVGHPDQIVVVRGKPVLWDLKTGPLQKTWFPQMAAYYDLALTRGIAPHRCQAIQLFPDGSTPRAFDLKDRLTAFKAFMACLQAWRYFNPDKGGVK